MNNEREIQVSGAEGDTRHSDVESLTSSKKAKKVLAKMAGEKSKYALRPDAQEILNEIARSAQVANQLLATYGYDQRVKAVFLKSGIER
jgi:hypothetical protein